MAYVDEESERLVLRIVYDGAPLSGKTTSLRALGLKFKRNVYSPGEAEGRTLWFDWMEYVGGSFDGHPIACQIVAVPGQRALDSRRRAILRDADALVYVLDCAPDRWESSLERLADARAQLRSELPPPPVGIVIQANKSDLPDAVEVPTIKAAVDDAATSVVRASATERQGVRETFVLAVRLAIDRAHALREAGALERRAALDRNPASLLGRMRAAERESPRTESPDEGPDRVSEPIAEAVSERAANETSASTPSEVRPNAGSPDEPASKRTEPRRPPKDPIAPHHPAGVRRWLPLALRHILPLIDRATQRARDRARDLRDADTDARHRRPHHPPSATAPPVEAVRTANPEPTPTTPPVDDRAPAPDLASPSTTGVPTTASLRLPGDDVPGGCIWPPVRGRVHLREAVEAGIEEVHPGEHEIRGTTRSGWTFTQPSALRFRDPSAARRALVEAARRRTRYQELISEQRCLVLASEDADDQNSAAQADAMARWRLWELVERRGTVAAAMSSAIEARDEEALARALLDAARAYSTSRRTFAERGRPEWLDLGQVAVKEGRLVYLGPVDDDDTGADEHATTVGDDAEPDLAADLRRAFGPWLSRERLGGLSVPRLITALESEAKGSDDGRALAHPLVAMAIGD